MMTNLRGRRHRRSGIAAVEMAVISPVLILILMGIIEFGWLFFFKQSMTTASRVGARYATLPASTTANIEAKVDEVMNNMGLTKAKYSYTVGITRATSGQPYETVTITVPYNKASIVGQFFGWLNITQIQVVSSFRRETET